MSNIILSSNNNSALIQSLNESESRVIPSIYSTKEIYAPYSTNWYTIDSSSGNTGDGQAVNFDLPKYGFLQQMLFSYTKNIDNDGTGGTADVALHQTPKGDIFNVIDRVELLSSSRILLTKYSEDLIAEFSALSSDQLYAISATAIKEGAAADAGVFNNSIKFVIPLTFFFDLNTMPNLSFNEPMSLRITFRDTKQYSVGKTVGSGNPTVSITSPQLMLRYKMYDEADTAQVLSNNYDSEQLNQLIRRQYRENPQTYVSAAGGTHTFELILRNVDVVNEFYALVRSKATGFVAGSNSADDVNDLAEIEELTLTASGQELCKLGKEQLLYMALTENGYQTSNSSLESTSGINLKNVNKIQTGLWCQGTGSGKWSNGWSLREMNNVQISVKCKVVNGKTYTCYVQETTSAIMSTSSATGRTAIALAN